MLRSSQTANVGVVPKGGDGVVLVLTETVVGVVETDVAAAAEVAPTGQFLSSAPSGQSDVPLHKEVTGIHVPFGEQRHSLRLAHVQLCSSSPKGQSLK